jgi:hypothetical protein
MDLAYFRSASHDLSSTVHAAVRAARVSLMNTCRAHPVDAKSVSAIQDAVFSYAGGTDGLDGEVTAAASNRHLLQGVE